MDHLRKDLEHNPWGVGVFVFVAVVGGVGALLSKVSLADYLAILATAGGLLGIGHSVHRGAMHMSRQRPPEEPRI